MRERQIWGGDDKGATEDQMIRLRDTDWTDSFGNERVTEEHTGQRVAYLTDLEDEFEELITGKR
jgi:hypothetical protein